MAQMPPYLDPIDSVDPEAKHTIDPDRASIGSYNSALTDTESSKGQLIEECEARQQELLTEWNRADVIGEGAYLQSSPGSSRPQSPQSQYSSPTSDSPQTPPSSRSSGSLSALQGAKDLPNPLRSHPVQKATGLGSISPFQTPQDLDDSDDPNDYHFGPGVRGSHGAISALTLTGDLDTLYHGRAPYMPARASNTDLHSPNEDAFDGGRWASSCSDIQPMPVPGDEPTGASEPNEGEPERESVHCIDWAAVRAEQSRALTDGNGSRQHSEPVRTLCAGDVNLMPQLREEEDNNSEAGDPIIDISEERFGDSDEEPKILTAETVQQPPGVTSSDATSQATSEKVKRIGSWETRGSLDGARREYQADEREDDSSLEKDPGSSSPSWLRSIITLPSRCLKSLTSSLSHLNPLTRARELFSIVAGTSRSRHTEAGTSLAKDLDQSSGALDNVTASQEGRLQSPFYSQTSVVNSCLDIHRLG